MKNIYLEPAGRLQSVDRELMLYPPEGYEFVIEPAIWDKATRGFINNDFIFLTLNRAVINRLLPAHIVKSYIEKFLKKVPEGIDLTYSRNHVVFRKEPWVVHIEWPTSLAGFNLGHFKRYKGIIEKSLASPYCRKIITWSEIAKKSILLNLDPARFETEVEVIPLAVHSKDFVKNSHSNKVKLLFVGTENVSGEFDIKGGREVLESFIRLGQKYDNLELVVRSDIPQRLKQKYQGQSNIKLIEKVIPWDQLEQEFKTADIFLFPGYHTPWKVILDAMSYELPVVVTDVYANSELVENGKTGFLIEPSPKIPYYQGNLIPTEHTPLKRQFRKMLHINAPAVVEQLVEKVSVLIENPALRRRMGKAGRWEVEHGRFSVKNRNEKLKRIFDEATV